MLLKKIIFFPKLQSDAFKTCESQHKKVPKFEGQKSASKLTISDAVKHLDRKVNDLQNYIVENAIDRIKLQMKQLLKYLDLNTNLLYIYLIAVKSPPNIYLL